MGGAQSKIEDEESVSRCKDRLNFLREVVMARNAFASGRSGYAMALKNTGAALCDYAQGEAEDFYIPHLGGRSPPLVEAEQLVPPPPFPVPTNIPVPPPMPRFLPTPASQSVTMPVMNNGVILEEEKEEEDNGSDVGGRKGGKSGSSAAAVDETPSPLLQTSVVPSRRRPPPPPPPPESESWDYFFWTGEAEDVIHEEEEEEDDDLQLQHIEEEEEDDDLQLQHTDLKWRGIKDTVNSGGNGGDGDVMDVRLRSVNLIKILGVMDDHFLKAFESVQEVSEIEARRLHYRSIFANNQGHFRRVATRNRSFRGAPKGENINDEEIYETHATVLDKLLAEEKKLYEGVKARELVKLEYQRKVLLLNKLKKQGATPKSVEKTKAAVSHLHTRYIIHTQSLDSTVSEVNDIRDTQLYPRLVALVDGMSKMWDSMCEHHRNQLKDVAYLSALDVSRVPKETTKHHHEQTVQLYNVVQSWHSDFETLVTQQKNYVQALDSWLKLTLVSIKSSLKENISSPQCVQTPPIQTLLHLWLDHLQKLPDEDVKCAIVSFAAVIETFINHQEEERKLKERCDELRKEYFRETHAFENWYHEYLMERSPQDEMDLDQVTGPDPISERRFVVEMLKTKLEDETEAHQKLCVQVREESLESLKIRLPELFRAMLDYAHVCRDLYQRLRSIVHSQNH